MGSRMVIACPGGERFPVRLFVSLSRITMHTSDRADDRLIPSARLLRTTRTTLKYKLHQTFQISVTVCNGHQRSGSRPGELLGAVTTASGTSLRLSLVQLSPQSSRSCSESYMYHLVHDIPPTMTSTVPSRAHRTTDCMTHLNHLISSRHAIFGYPAGGPNAVTLGPQKIHPIVRAPGAAAFTVSVGNRSRD